MAYLRNVQSDEKLYLQAHHTFGRHSDSVDTVLPQAPISKIHSVIEWNSQHWHIRDLSRNGTWLDQQKLAKAEKTPLQIGQTINFGHQSDTNWVVENLDPPCNLLIGLNAASHTEALSHYHLLPDTQQPLAALFYCNVRGQWLFELRSAHATDEEEQTVIPANGRIQVGEQAWQLFLNHEQAPTVELVYQPPKVEDCAFQFDVSLDEEHTQLQLHHGSTTIDLGERSHHYLLLHLLRLKAQHAQQGFDNNSQGWIQNEQLAKELGLDISHINILIFRARKQIAEAFPEIPGLADLLQRRRGGVRFNCPCATVNKGATTETLGHATHTYA